MVIMGCAPFTYDPFTYHPFYLQVVGKRVGHHYWSSISQTDLNDPVSNSCNFLEFGQRIKLSFNDKQGGPLLVPPKSKRLDPPKLQNIPKHKKWSSESEYSLSGESQRGRSWGDQNKLTQNLQGKFCEFILVQAMSQSEEVFATPDQPLAFVSAIECETLCYEKWICNYKFCQWCFVRCVFKLPAWYDAKSHLWHCLVSLHYVLLNASASHLHWRLKNYIGCI